MKAFNPMPLPKQVLLFFFLAVVLTLTQCAEKTSDDYVQEGIERTGRQDYSQAMSSFQKAIEKNPRNPEAYVGLGGIYNQKSMHIQAKQAFSKAIQLDPTHVDAYYSLGFTYEMLNEREKAETFYLKHRSLKKKLNDLVKKEQEKP